MPSLCLKAVSLAVLLFLAAACNTTGKPGNTAKPADPASPAVVEVSDEADADTKAADGAAAIEATAEEEELAYEPDSLTFDIRLSAALRSADNVLFLRTPDGVNLNEIPDDLDKWLSRIRDNGGSVKAAPLPADGKPSRSLLGILIGLCPAYAPGDDTGRVVE